MKKKYMAIIWSITILCIIIGIVIHVGGFLGRLGSRVFDGKLFSFGGSEQTTEISSTEQYSGIKELEPDCDLANVTITGGDSLDISYTGSKDLQPIIKNNGSKLQISQPKNNKTRLNSLKNTENTINITVPTDGSLTSIDAEIDLGNLEITDIVCDALDVNMNLGNAQINGSRAGRIDAENDMGNIEVHDTEFDSIRMDCDMGNITLDGIGDISVYDISTDCSLGSVSVNGDSVSGKYRSNGGDKTITLTAAMGNIEIYE